VSELASEIEDLVARAGSRGHDALVAGVFANGAPAFHDWRRAGALPDERTLFEIGSVTKPLTGVLLADMVLRGEVNLEDPVSRYLPRARLPRWRERESTLEELATHRTSLPNTPRGLGRFELAFALGLRARDPWADVDAAAYRAAVRATAARRPPGSRVRYSSLGFGLLGDVLAARAGVSYDRLLHERLTSPLGLTDTAITVPSKHRARLLDGRSRRGHPRPPLRDEIAGGRRHPLERTRPAAAPRRLLGAVRPRAGAGDDPRHPATHAGGPPLGDRPRLDDPAPPQAAGAHLPPRWRVGVPELRRFVPARGVGVVVLANSARSVDRLGLRLIDLASR
jgi:CubicO group peptidase (beta-lactamase class C family)